MTEAEKKPSDPELFQAGGHGKVTKTEIEGTVIKLTDQHEIDVYLWAQTLPKEIQAFFPKYYNSIIRDQKHYILIEDLTYGMEQPCVLDIKIGTTTIGPDCYNPVKKIYMHKKDKKSTTHILGLRLAGARVYQKDTGKYIIRSNKWGSKLKSEEFIGALASFFYNGERPRIDVCRIYLTKLKSLSKWFETQASVKFVGSSLLFTYDGASESAHANVAMIDFAHVFMSKDGRDEGYLTGLTNLITHLEVIISNYTIKNPS